MSLFVDAGLLYSFLFIINMVLEQVDTSCLKLPGVIWCILYRIGFHFLIGCWSSDILAYVVRSIIIVKIYKLIQKSVINIFK